MSATKRITIAGGGLAGLSLGIGLRQRGVPVVLWEAGKYPRHRVCGEFISGDGQRILRDLDLFDALVTAGARPAATVAVFSRRSGSPPIPLPTSAWCLSRFTLDELLARRFREIGGELLTSRRWQAPAIEGLVRATGRHGRAIVNGWRWFGLKAHARGAALQADLEMHLSEDGYVGLCQLTGDEINVCGLFRSRSTLPDLAQHWPDLLRGPPDSHRYLRLREAVFDEASFCSVSGLAFEAPTQTDFGECLIGDALTMIPPVTGNGMSMAFESAEHAISPLQAYSRGEVSWTEACQNVACACDAAFKRRLAWSLPIQRLLFERPFREALALLVACCPWFLRCLFTRTR